jgi:hypothetical protein
LADGAKTASGLLTACSFEAGLIRTSVPFVIRSLRTTTTSSFDEEVWLRIKSSHQLAGYIACRSTTVTGWWKKIMRYRKKKPRRDLVTIAVYGMWHLWKERNRRIFEDIALDPANLVFQIRDGLQSLKTAFGE